jgi:hypothetical protein
MTILVANGCSHTSGSELYKNRGECAENRNFSYAKKVADKLGYGYVNLAINGGSNDYIFRSTIEFINKNIKNIQNYVFLIGWTSSLRIELRYDNKNEYLFNRKADISFYDKKYIPITPGTDISLFEDKRFGKMIKKNKDLLIEETFCSDKFANYAFSLQSIFEIYNIKYFMFNTIHGQIETDNNKETLKNLLKNPKYYNPLDHNDTFFFYCRDVLGHTNITKYWHHQQPAHNDWGEIMYERTKQWLS